MQRGAELLRMTVLGKPAGAGSKTAMPVTRGRGGPLVFRSPPTIKGGQVWGQPMLNYTHQSKRTEPWMKHVITEAQVAWRGKAPVDGALYLDCHFFEDRTTDHFFHRKGGDVLRPDAPAYPDATSQHDVDKLRRALADCLTQARVIVDDKRLVGGEDWKHFTHTIEGFDKPCVFLRLGKMDFQTAEQAGFVTPAPEGQAALV